MSRFFGLISCLVFWGGLSGWFCILHGGSKIRAHHLHRSAFVRLRKHKIYHVMCYGFWIAGEKTSKA